MAQNTLSLIEQEKSCLMVVDVQEKLIAHIEDNEKIIKKSKWLMDLSNELKVPVLISEQYPKGLGTTVSTLNTKDNSYYLQKVHFSCTKDPSFNNLLTDLNKSHFVLIGIETHVCVLQTAIGLKNLNKQVFVVVDATGSRDSIDYKYGLKRMLQHGVELVTAEMVFFEWLKLAGTEKFKKLSQLFLKGDK